MIGLVFLIVPILIYYLLPQYVPGITPVKIIVCAVFFFSLVGAATNFLITVNKERKILFIQAFAILFAAVLNYFAIMRGYGIIGVAVQLKKEKF